jgi:hypothetical protein
MQKSSALSWFQGALSTRRVIPEFTAAFKVLDT